MIIHPLRLLFAISAVMLLGSTALASEQTRDNSRRTAYQLSISPQIELENGVCHVRGAVYLNGTGPVPNEAVSLKGREGKIYAIAKTDRYGFYETSIVLPGHGLVLQEKDHEQRSARRFDRRKWSQGATVVCANPRVEIGLIEQT